MAKRISVTMLCSYAYCKRKLFLEYVLGLFEPEKEALVKGTIRHDTYEGVNEAEEQIVTSITEKDNLESIYQKYLQTYSKLLREAISKNRFRLQKVKLPLIDAYQQIMPFFRTESELRARRVIKFIEENHLYGQELWENLIPKIKSEISVESESLELAGRIDQIEIYPDGFVPIELKTGSVPKQGVWPSHRIQIAAYALLMEEKFNKDIKEGFVYYLDSHERRQIAINPFMKEEVKELKDKVRQLLSNFTLPDPESNTNKCAKCGLKDQCYNHSFILDLLEQKKSAQQ